MNEKNEQVFALYTKGIKPDSTPEQKVEILTYCYESIIGRFCQELLWKDENIVGWSNDENFFIGVILEGPMGRTPRKPSNRIFKWANQYVCTFKSKFPDREVFEDDSACDDFYEWVRKNGLNGWADAIADKLCKMAK